MEIREPINAGDYQDRDIKAAFVALIELGQILNRGQLSVECIERLNVLGFDWGPIATRWEEMFRKLLEFKLLHGHTNVPQIHPEWKDLGTWVRNQRRAMSQNQPIMEKRAERLDEVGFQWRVREGNVWEEMFIKLTVFRDKYGYCNVPQRWDEDRELGRWVNTQRIHFRRGDIADVDRIKRLEAIGFVWNVRLRKSR